MTAVQLASEARHWPIRNLAAGRHRFGLRWGRSSECRSSCITHLHSSPSWAAPFLARGRVAGQDHAGSLVLVDPLLPARRGKLLRSHPGQPCLGSGGGSPAVSGSYAWRQLQFPLLLLLTCEFQGFLNWSQSSIISAAGCRKESALHVSLFAPPRHTLLFCLNSSVSGLCPPWRSNQATTTSCSGHDSDAANKSPWRTRRGITRCVFWITRLFGSHGKRVLWREI